jgi:hypothetical protein
MPSTIDLYINTSAGARRSLVQGYDVLSTPSNPEFVVRDDVRIRIHLMTVASGSRTGTTFDPGVGSTIRFGAKLLSNFVTSSSFLFYSDIFTRDASDPDDVFFYADIDLNTTQFIAAFTGTTSTIALRIECEVENSGITQTVMQNDAVGLFDVIRGDEPAPSPSVTSLTLTGTLTANSLVGETLSVTDATIANEFNLTSGAITFGSTLFNGPTGSFSGTPTLGMAPRVVSGSTTAVINEELWVSATATITDPTPVANKGYKVFVLGGTVTVGGSPFSQAGTLLYRWYHNSAWSTTHFKPHGGA